jgi:hypothetical protein
MARHVAKTSTVVRASKTRRVPKGGHAHGCVSCSKRYEDGCETPLVNAYCSECRKVPHPRPVWQTNSDPIGCCYENSRLMGVEVMFQFSLGGDTDWYRCRSCSRTHPFNPQEKR